MVVAVRAADGRYAKVEILSYYRGAPEPDALDPRQGFGFYTFRYLFQPDGSRRLQ